MYQLRVFEVCVEVSSGGQKVGINVGGGWIPAKVDIYGTLDLTAQIVLDHRHIVTYPKQKFKLIPRISMFRKTLAVQKLDCKNAKKNIQQQGFAGGHPPNY